MSASRHCHHGKTNPKWSKDEQVDLNYFEAVDTLWLISIADACPRAQCGLGYGLFTHTNEADSRGKRCPDGKLASICIWQDDHSV